MSKIKAIIFDWGDTLMIDYTQYSGPMIEWERVDAVSGVKEVLPIIYKDYICCVASNAGDSDANLMKLALARVELDKFFREFFTSRELGFQKPNIEFFVEILKRLNLKAKEVIMVGNDYIKDIQPAKKVGMSTILYSKDKQVKEYIDADYVIESMEQLNLAILQVEKRA